jgi:hypothetical protein
MLEKNTHTAHLPMNTRSTFGVFFMTVSPVFRTETHHLCADAHQLFCQLWCQKLAYVLQELWHELWHELWENREKSYDQSYVLSTYLPTYLLTTRLPVDLYIQIQIHVDGQTFQLIHVSPVKRSRLYQLLAYHRIEMKISVMRKE